MEKEEKRNDCQSCHNCKWHCKYDWAEEKSCLWRRTWDGSQCDLWQPGAGCCWDCTNGDPSEKQLYELVPRICATCEGSSCKNCTNCGCDPESSHYPEVGLVDGKCPHWHISSSAHYVAGRLYKVNETMKHDNGESPLWRI